MAVKKKKVPTNPIAVAMTKRYGTTTKKMKDRRTPRGGSKNKMKDILNENDD